MTAINNFNAQRTPGNLHRIKNAGITPKELINNKWRPLTGWNEGFKEFQNVIPLYEKVNGILTVTGAGFYKKLDR